MSFSKKRKHGSLQKCFDFRAVVGTKTQDEQEYLTMPARKYTKKDQVMLKEHRPHQKELAVTKAGTIQETK